MAVYNVFLPGYKASSGFNPANITGGARLTTEPPLVGTMFLGVNGATAAAAAAALQAGIGQANQAGLMQVALQSNTTAV